MEPLGRNRLDPRVLAVIERLAGAGHEAWLVGGAVRDTLLGRPFHEYDLATSARAEVVAGLFPKVVATGLQHGTVTVVTGRLPVEVTTYRGAGAYAGGQPREVESVGTIEEDLAHRDLTVNALAWDPLRERLLDPFGGAEDLRCRRIRGVGDPLARFEEDPLRTMRAVRFASTLGFVLERKTRRAIPPLLGRFAQVAVERIRHELEKILRGDRPRYGIELLRRTGLLPHVLPELLDGFGLRQNRWHRYDVYHHTLRTVDATPAILPVRLAALLHDIDKPRSAAPSAKAPGEHTFYNHENTGAAHAKAILLRLRFPHRICDEVALLVREHQFVYSDEWSDGAVRRMMARVGKENLDHLLAVREADIRGRGFYVEEGLANAHALERRVRLLREKALALTVRDLAIGGREVMEALGEGPSPRIGEAMEWLLGQVLEEPSRNDPEQLRALLATWKSS
ncbi:CCA tRNA nucleotidyltransferase [Vulgatibacter sp.]|uniref:CCA tRNA nucleotidyltransferase n=1 Tax=Vulgatibacter sp. TaxID=1971226 RepID=UPI003563C6EB